MLDAIIFKFPKKLDGLLKQRFEFLAPIFTLQLPYDKFGIHIDINVVRTQP